MWYMVHNQSEVCVMEIEQNWKRWDVYDEILLPSLVKTLPGIQKMGVLHSSFLPEHHDTHGKKLIFCRKTIVGSYNNVS